MYPLFIHCLLQNSCLLRVLIVKAHDPVRVVWNDLEHL